MAKLLLLESSTEVCSVALSEDSKLIDLVEDKSGQNHSRLLTVFVNNILKNNQLKPSEIDAVAISGGPGSYTGLRIGVSVAKGFCYANQIPLIAISTLEAMFRHVVQNKNKYLKGQKQRLFCPMMDARRMEVYTCMFSQLGEEIKPISAEIINSESFKAERKQSELVFFGNGALKCKDEISDLNAVFIDGIIASAAHMTNLAFELYTKKQFVDLAYYEPFYLKDFVALKPKNSVLGK